MRNQDQGQEEEEIEGNDSGERQEVRMEERKREEEKWKRGGKSCKQE